MEQNGCVQSFDNDGLSGQQYRAFPGEQYDARSRGQARKEEDWWQERKKKALAEKNLRERGWVWLKFCCVSYSGAGLLTVRKVKLVGDKQLRTHSTGVNASGDRSDWRLFM